MRSLRTRSGEVQVECAPSLALERCRSSAHLALVLEWPRSSALLEHSLWSGPGPVLTLHSLWRGAGRVHSLSTRFGEVQVKCTPCALALEWLRSSAHLALALERCRLSTLLEHLLWRGTG